MQRTNSISYNVSPPAFTACSETDNLPIVFLTDDCAIGIVEWPCSTAIPVDKHTKYIDVPIDIE